MAIKTEDLQFNQTATPELLFDFLGLDKSPTDDIQPRMVYSNEYEDMSNTDRQFLQEAFKPEIDKLEDLLDWDCASWKQ